MERFGYCPDCGEDVKFVDGLCLKGHQVVGTSDKKIQKPVEIDGNSSKNSGTESTEEPQIEDLVGETLVVSESILFEGALVFKEGEMITVEALEEPTGEGRSQLLIVHSNRLGRKVKLPRSKTSRAGEEINAIPIPDEEEIPFREGETVVIATELVLEGKYLFRAGDRVTIGKIVEAPDDQPDARFIVTSTENGKAYRLSTNHFKPPAKEEPTARQRQPAQEARRETAFCVECGAQITPTSKFCKSCGAQTGRVASQGPVHAQGAGYYTQQQQGFQRQPVARPMVKPVVAMGMICPNCQSGDIGGGERPSWTIVVAVCLFPIGLLALLYKEPYYCTNCGYTWKASSF